MSARESIFSQGEAGKIALLWRGNGHALGEPTVQNNRLNPVFEALTALGIRVEPAIYADHMADGVRQQLLKVEWCARLGRSDFRRPDPDATRCNVAGCCVQRGVG